MRNQTFLFGVLLLVNGMFGVDADEVSVSVMVGDSVTLHTDFTETPRESKIIWKFNNQIIAKMNGANGGNPSTYDGPGAVFKDRLKLDKQTGSLTITNIRSEHVGHYSVDIKSTDAKLKTFQVTVHGGVKTISAMKGDPVNLHTGVIEIRGYDLILWTTEGNVVAEVNKQTNLFGPRDEGDVRFGGRLHLHRETGDLTISDSKTTDSGDYHLHMSNSAHTLERTIRVIVKTQPQSGAASVICNAGVGLVVWAVFLVARFVDNEWCGKGVSVNIK
ncbi:hypothetical protein Q8A67_005699 [Cirrhinus molitorella]|uniref:Immunoglobulin domain-containing protein n=1 Tax=Cirrhinus molitorella TaxID=172907 RepID=A0AA88TTZ7_9TELE|nr:hypothetical protein Q8A67_005699 [Cirrhinus molitorella]